MLPTMRFYLMPLDRYKGQTTPVLVYRKISILSFIFILSVCQIRAAQSDNSVAARYKKHHSEREWTRWRANSKTDHDRQMYLFPVPGELKMCTVAMKWQMYNSQIDRER